METIIFTLGLFTGASLGTWVVWSYCKKELDKWEEIFEEMFIQINGYNDLKERLKK